MRTVYIAACALAAPLGACDMGSCPLSVEPGLRVEVRDRATNEYLVTTPRAVAREGSSQDSLEVSSFSADVPPRVAELQGWVPVGRYTVHLVADGYQPWDTAGVRVTEGDCGILTTRFIAALVKP